MRHLPLHAGITAALAALATPAFADEPIYAGIWSKRMEHCSTDQKRPGAPMIVTAEGFDQHELHCKFGTIEPAANSDAARPEWRVVADCTWKGTATSMEMTWSISGETLSITDKGGINQLKKCVPPPPRP